MKLYVIAGRGGGVQEMSIRPFGQWELLSIHNISSVASEPERAAEARSAVVASFPKSTPLPQYHTSSFQVTHKSMFET